ncbi:hypothetical protein DFH08DRAFT_817663 [Mycena albidolilacea]|uniref:Secreted protein n=1 Tax=Mycena albidolilacea TaxID=1033008 RepID=A0AAD7EI80_9AGAR|nr:hypothetical protein DFH08DRAFT_817663 [Mycena albidolilacea]
MKETLLTRIFVFLVTAVASRMHHSTDTDEDCVVDVWVRAEDLAPDHVSHDIQQAMVTPFIIATPPVNYPPSVYNRRATSVTALPVRRHTYSVVGYCYTAVVNFTNGRSLDVPVGHTNFALTSPAPPPKTPFTWNVTFATNFGYKELLTTYWITFEHAFLKSSARCLWWR